MNSNLPANYCYNKGHGRKDVAHSTGKGWGGELQAHVVKVLIYDRPAVQESVSIYAI